MAITVAKLKDRVDKELNLFGYIHDTSKTKLVNDAMSLFIDETDLPIIPASLSIVANTATYSVPGTIRKLQDIRDADGVSQVYSYDETLNKITFQTTPEASATWTAYGTPEDVETNIDTVIAAVKPSDERVLWAFLSALIHESANAADADSKLKRAEYMAKRLRMSRNRRLDYGSATFKTLDSIGQNIADSNNAEGHIAGINDLYESDL
jgi:hypothetical protein